MDSLLALWLNDGIEAAQDRSRGSLPCLSDLPLIERSSGEDTYGNAA